MQSKKTGRKAARAYKDRGFAPIPIPAGSKNPGRKDWQHERHSVEDIPKLWNNGQGVGLLLGEPSGGLVDVDLDCPEAVRLGGRFLTPTRTSGREGIPDSHWWYFSPATATTKFKDIGGEMLVELRSTGCQTVVEPSLHPDGGRYLWSRSGLEIETIEATTLLKACRELATAVLIARHLPATGRHDFALALAGFLLRNGLADEAVLTILTAAWSVKNAPREALRDLEGIVRDTRSRLDRGESVKGGRTLEDLVEGMPKTLAKYMGWEKADNRKRPTAYALSDLGNAERFIAMYGDKVRWCPALKSFLVYDDKRWARDDRGQVVKLAHEVARTAFKDAALEPDLAKQREIAKFALASQNESRISGMLSQTKPYLAVGMDELDRDPWAINCLNGTLDLRTGALRVHAPTEHITKLASVEYNPDADCPRFKKFLKETLVDDAVISFVKRFAGYTLTGVTRERLFAILHGPGKNGKTTLVELLQDVMGDYAMNTDTETILAKKYQGVGNDVAALKGARFVSAAEVEQGRRLAESKVKQLTGSDTVTARFLFCEPFNFRPEFKLWLSTNNKPVIQGTDDAIWDRIRLIPFTQRFEGSKADPKLPEKLREELPGILAWMVAGCLEWQEHGLGEPERVTNATNAYRTEMDVIAAFIDECCIVRPDAWVRFAELFDVYTRWCDASGETPEKKRAFGNLLTDRGYQPDKGTKNVSIRRGIGVGTDRTDGPDGDGVTHEADAEDAHERANTRESTSEDNPGYSSSGESNPENTCKTQDFSEGVTQGYSKSKNFSSESLTKERTWIEDNHDNRVTRRLSKDEQRQVQKLMSEGMEAKLARASVLGEEVAF